MFHSHSSQMDTLFAENAHLHYLLDSRSAEIALLRRQVDERDATLVSFREPVYDILAAVTGHVGNTTDLASEAKAANRDLLMEECEEAIAADDGDAELAAVEEWVAETPAPTKPTRHLPPHAQRCAGICASGDQCSRRHGDESHFCRIHLNMAEAATEKEAAKAAKLAEKEVAKATKLAEKEAAKATKLAEKEAAKATKLAEIEATKATKLAEIEAAKATKAAEKEAAKATKLAEKKAKADAKLAEKAFGFGCTKSKCPTPPFALWRSDAKTQIAEAVAADTSDDPYLSIVARLWKALPDATRDYYKEQTKTLRSEGVVAAVLAEMSTARYPMDVADRVQRQAGLLRQRDILVANEPDTSREEDKWLDWNRATEEVETHIAAECDNPY
jgi:hypothetical protein